MTPRMKFLLRWSVTAFAVAWLGMAGVNEYFELGVFRYQAQKDREALDRQLAECRGNFKQRYECKSQLLRAYGTSSFNYWSTRLGIVFGPPFVLYVLYQLGMGLVTRQEQKSAQARRIVRLEEKAEEERLAALEEARQRKIAAERAKVFRDAKSDSQKARVEEPIQALVIDPGEAGIKLANELGEHGYVAVASTNPDDALIGFKTLPYRLVITETEFKGKGVKLDEAIESMRKYKDDLWVVAVSEKFPKMSADEVQKTAVALGADVGFPKPVEVEIFAEIARRLLEVKRPEPEPEAGSLDEPPLKLKPTPDGVHEDAGKSTK